MIVPDGLQKKFDKITDYFQYVIIFLGGIFPYFLIFHSGLPAWLGRFISLFILFLIMILLLVYLIFVPFKKIGKKQARIIRETETQIKWDRYFLRAFMVGLLLIGMYFLYIPFFKDIYQLGFGNENIESVNGKISYENSFMGMWYFYQSLKIENDDKSYEYCYAYFSRPIRKGDLVEFRYLKNSGLVLECNKAD